MSVTESELPKADIANLAEFSRQVITDISAPRDSEPSAWIDALVYKWQQDGQSPNPEIESTTLLNALAISWANEIINEFGWQWRSLTFHQFNNWSGLAIVSPDRSLMILPFAFLHECLSGSEEVKISVASVALRSAIIPKQQEYSYTNLMHGLQRILPRG